MYNIKLIHLGEQRRALNDYILDLVNSDKYSLDYSGMYRWVERLQDRLDCGNYLDIPKDVLHAVFLLDSYISRVRAYCVNNHKDYDTITAGLNVYADKADNLTTS